MKEKIGMKKLIELLNECRAEHDVYPVVYDEKDLDSLWILKRFIKWLVDNDKIELEAGPLYGCQLIMHNRQPYTLYETLLMLLAISDTPIEDLISYLK